MPSESLSPPDTTSQQQSESPYDQFAAAYNRHLGDFARRLAGRLERWLSIEPPLRVLDVCCGTGQLAHELTRRGFAVTGIDASAGMLALARANAPAATFLLGDVRSAPLPTGFPLAVSTFDSLNHLVGDGDLRAALANVARSLTPVGRFVFDLNLDEGYRRRWWGVWQISDEQRDFTVRAVYCPETRLARNLVTAVPRGRASSSSAFEAIEQWEFVERCYEPQEVRDALRQAGFAQVEQFDCQRDLGLIGEVGRALFVACNGASRSRQRAAVPSPRRLRQREQCQADGVWPAPATVREAGQASRRLRAIEDVLCRLPDEPYAVLCRRAGRLRWYVPHASVLGQVFPGAPRAARGDSAPAAFVYLAPELERQSAAVNRAVVAHELAHVILGHRLEDLDQPARDSQERAARQAVDDWGFKGENRVAENELRAGWFGCLSPAEATSASAARQGPNMHVDGEA
ncbi:MAG: methyltransferase domain-containing protein [Pirellulaceae bacterium]|nr:methyltransferase domain-containing protein [Pirellulaceae bacterium]